MTFLLLSPLIVPDLLHEPREFEALKRLNRKRAKQFDASLNLQRGVSEVAKFFRIAAAYQRRVGNSPMGHDRLAGKDRTGLASAVAHGNNKIELYIFEFIP